MREKEELIVFSKCELVDTEMLEEMRVEFEASTEKKVDLIISAWAYIRVDDLKDLLIQRIPENRPPLEILTEDKDGILLAAVGTEKKSVKVYDLRRASDPKRVSIKKREDGDYDVTGERMEEIARMTDLRYIDGVNRIYDVMERLGVIRRIKAMVTSDMVEGRTGFFEWEDDIASPSVWISGKKFSLENVMFMREGK
jgi:Domain of unknown function (DUF1967)